MFIVIPILQYNGFHNIKRTPNISGDEGINIEVFFFTIFKEHLSFVQIINYLFEQKIIFDYHCIYFCVYLLWKLQRLTERAFAQLFD